MSSLPTGGFLTRKNGEAEAGVSFYFYFSAFLRAVPGRPLPQSRILVMTIGGGVSERIIARAFFTGRAKKTAVLVSSWAVSANPRFRPCCVFTTIASFAIRQVPAVFVSPPLLS